MMHLCMTEEIEVLVKAEESTALPVYASSEAAGADVCAHLKEPLILQPGASALVPTGLFLEIPSGYEVQVRPRSGLAFKHQVTVLNTPGTIDSDYRGEVKVLLINHGKNPFTVENGMRIAQLVVAPVVRGCFVPEECLSATARGSGGFGSTGGI